jgi:GT2 family glycosyltransferase/ADP-heptose:LPS heptosyltransferase
MADPLLTISIATHNALEHTRKCIESLIAFTKDVPFKLIVIDNASSDDTVKYLTSTLAVIPDVEIIENKDNLGFIVPHNAAFSRCTTKYFVVLNNDVTLCKDWASRMLAEFEKNPKVVSCGIEKTCNALNDKGVGVPGNGNPEYVEASCMMVDVASVRTLKGGLFDTVYKFGYYEDSDLGLRIRSAGMQLAVVNIPVIHVGGATSRIVKGVDLEGYKIRNRHIFLGRWEVYLKKRSIRPITKDRIVVKRMGAQGDVILVTPILRQLRVLYPMSVICVQTSCKDVLANNKDVNEVGPGVVVGDGNYFIDLDLSYERAPDKHIVQAYADTANLELVGEDSWKPRVFPSSTAQQTAKQRMPSGRKYAVIHPGVTNGWVGRQWPWKRFMEVQTMLRSLGYTTVLIGRTDTPNIQADMDLRNIPFDHTASVIERANLFVGLDSMPFHLAQAFGVKSVVLFGSIDPALRVIPKCPVIPVVAKSLGCLGCHHWLPAPRMVTNSCVRGADLCMDQLQVDQVIDAVAEVEKRFPS